MEWLASVAGLLLKPFAGLWHGVKTAQARAPRNAMRFVIDPMTTDWFPETEAPESPIAVSLSVHATNVTEQPLKVLRAQLPRYGVDAAILKTVDHLTGAALSDAYIGPKQTTKVFASFRVKERPPDGGSLTTRVLLEDSLANRYTMKVRFPWAKSVGQP